MSPSALIHGPELVNSEASGRSAEALRIDHGRRLDEYARLMSAQRNRRPEARDSPRLLVI